MNMNGVRPNEMTADELDGAEAYMIEAMRKTQEHYELLRCGYEELAAERARRADFSTDRTLN